MKIISASDLFYPNTNVMKAGILDCEPLTSSFGFPYVKSFPTHWKKAWKSIILTLILPRARNIPLGDTVSQSHLNDQTVPIPSHSETEMQHFDFSKYFPNLNSEKFQDGANHILSTIQSSPNWMKHI